MVSLEEVARIAEIEFSDIVDSTELMGSKLRIMLSMEGFIDVWLSRKLTHRFGYHFGKTNPQVFLTVTIIFPTPTGNMFLPIRIIFTTALKIM